jgi:hypothetical protein
MTDIEAKNAESTAGNPTNLRLDCNLVPVNIFMTSASDFP